uniref:Uncharacterized protein n=1 Tax=Cacopsylla melanoneura TaxID=428564 RepID=A0A8D8Y858_9HEMI
MSKEDIYFLKQKMGSTNFSKWVLLPLAVHQVGQPPFRPIMLHSEYRQYQGKQPSPTAYLQLSHLPLYLQPLKWSSNNHSSPQPKLSPPFHNNSNSSLFPSREHHEAIWTLSKKSAASFCPIYLNCHQGNPKLLSGMFDHSFRNLLTPKWSQNSSASDWRNFSMPHLSLALLAF